MTDSHALSIDVLPEGPVAEALLGVYFFGRDRARYGDGRDGVAYTGASFETIGRRWDAAARLDRFTATDLVAVSTLSVEVPARAAIKILGEDGPELSSLLRAIPADVDLWDVERTGDEMAAATQLWDRLRSYKGMGQTTTSKLIARKRPRLVPIYDKVIKKQLELRGSLRHWDLMHDLLNSSHDGALLHEWLGETGKRAGLSEIVTPLRVFDVIVWMSGRPEGLVDTIRSHLGETSA